MKISRTDAHDRFEHVIKTNELDIGKTCQEIIESQPFGTHPFYIFGHKRQIGLDERKSIFQQDWTESLVNSHYKRQFTRLEDVPTDRLIWQPRLTKPKAQSNSMLFKAYPGTDNVKVIWMIPARELWEQYSKGKMTENKMVSESIYDFENNPRKLEAPEEDDLSDEVIKKIYEEISKKYGRPGKTQILLDKSEG